MWARGGKENQLGIATNGGCEGQPCHPRRLVPGVSKKGKLHSTGVPARPPVYTGLLAHRKAIVCDICFKSQLISNVSLT